MNYRSVQQMSRLLAREAGALSQRFDVVVGVPRSGLLAANLLALHANLPMTDVQGLIKRRLLSAGRRLTPETDSCLAEPQRVLVLDDSVRTGRQMRQVKDALARLSDRHELAFAAVYGLAGAEAKVDHIFETCPDPRMFEWNLMHHSLLSRACVDIDGVLCVDPTDWQNDDGPHYEKFLLAADPLHLPTRPVGRLVTSRLEKYRPHTEQWLADHHVAYDQLIMLDLPDMATRRRLAIHAQFKGEVYRDCNAQLFIESHARQAPVIADIAAKPVICMETGRLHQPGGKALVQGVVRRFSRTGLRRSGLADTRLGRWLGQVAAPELGYDRTSPSPKRTDAA